METKTETRKQFYRNRLDKKGNNKKSFFTKKECAEILSVSVDTIQKLCREGKLTFVRPAGNILRIPKTSFYSLIENSTMKGVY